MADRVAVLGRGKSLGRFKDYSHLFDTVYMVGTIYKEVRKIGVKHFQNKKITHLVGRSDWGWRGGVEKKLNIIRVHMPYYPHELPTKKGKKSYAEKYKNFKLEFLPEIMENRGYPVAPREAILKYSAKYGREELCKYLEENFKKEIADEVKKSLRSRYWPTTGSYAIELALRENNPKELYLFGIDIFKTDSFIKYSWEPKGLRLKVDKNMPVVAKLMTYNLKELVKEFQSTQFLSSYDTIDGDYPNWRVL